MIAAPLAIPPLGCCGGKSSADAISMPPGPRRGSKVSGAGWRARRVARRGAGAIKLFSAFSGISTKPGDNSVEKLYRGPIERN